MPGDVPDVVVDAEDLRRLINPRQNAVRDGKVGYIAFFSKTPPWEISVDRSSYRTLAEALQQHPGWGAATLNAGAVRSVAVQPPLQIVAIAENGNDAHANIVADSALTMSGYRTHVCRKLAELAALEVLPEEVPSR